MRGYMAIVKNKQKNTKQQQQHCFCCVFAGGEKFVGIKLFCRNE